MRLVRRSDTKIMLALAVVSVSLAHASEMCAYVGNWNGSPVPRARVSALNLATTKRYEGTSDRTGRVCLSDIPEGLYAVEASAVSMNVRYYPVRVGTERTKELTFHLPAGENSEGPIVNVTFLSGTLRLGDAPLDWAEVCLTKRDSQAIPYCMRTNDLGEYAMEVDPGLYDVEVCTEKKLLFKSVLDVRSAGFYRERVSVTPPGVHVTACPK